MGGEDGHNNGRRFTEQRDKMDRTEGEVNEQISGRGLTEQQEEERDRQWEVQMDRTMGGDRQNSGIRWTEH